MIKVTMILPVESKMGTENIRRILGPVEFREPNVTVGYKITRGIDYYVHCWATVASQEDVGLVLKNIWKMFVDSGIINRKLRGTFKVKVEDV